MRLQNGEKIFIDKWDLIIAHPPCTYLTTAATSAHSTKVVPVNWINARVHQRISAMDFFMACIEANCDKIAVENPKGVMNTVYRKPDQIIEPYYFAESEDDSENYVTKSTCLWLKGLEPLKRTNELEKPDNGKLFGISPRGKAYCWNDRINSDRATNRSKTFPGVAKAMAEQWAGNANIESDGDCYGKQTQPLGFEANAKLVP